VKGSDEMTTSVLLCGVGGQGILKLNDLLAEAALLSGFDVKGNEVHGMAQRGGSVVCHLRFSRDQVYSPLIPAGDADFIISLEKIEALRYGSFLKPEGKVVVNDFKIIPTTVSIGQAKYPEHAETLLSETFHDLTILPAQDIAQEAGNPRAANTVLAGFVSHFLPFSQEVWEETLSRMFPGKLLGINRKAFHAGAAEAKQKKS